jgi:outer membrane cobalamin receptor
VQLRLPRGARLKSSYGRAFKLPSFYSLSHPLIGDPNLLPERSESADIAVVQDLAAGVEVEFTWFHARFEDLVDYDPNVAPFGRMVNRDEVTSQGFEAALAVRLPYASELSAHFSRAKTEVQETGDPLNERPEWQAVLALAHRRPAGHTVELRWRYVGAIPSFSYPAGQSQIGAYGRLDLSVLLRVTEQLRCSLSIENLSDVEYEEALGVPGPGIVPRLGIQSDF